MFKVIGKIVFIRAFGQLVVLTLEEIMKREMPEKHAEYVAVVQRSYERKLTDFLTRNARPVPDTAADLLKDR